jgi:hypothetical protein
LGNTVTSASGLNSIGQLNELQVDNINVNGSTITFLNVSIADGTITLVPKGTGTVDVSSKFISNLATPIPTESGGPGSPGHYAANKSFVEAKVRKAPLGFTVNKGARTEIQLATDILSKIFPPSDHEENTALRVWCPDVNAGVGVAKEYRLVSSVWLYQTDL